LIYFNIFELKLSQNGHKSPGDFFDLYWVCFSALCIIPSCAGIYKIFAIKISWADNGGHNSIY